MEAGLLRGYSFTVVLMSSCSAGPKTTVGVCGIRLRSRRIEIRNKAGTVMSEQFMNESLQSVQPAALSFMNAP